MKFNQLHPLNEKIMNRKRESGAPAITSSDSHPDRICNLEAIPMQFNVFGIISMGCFQRIAVLSFTVRLFLLTPIQMLYLLCPTVLPMLSEFQDNRSMRRMKLVAKPSIHSQMRIAQCPAISAPAFS